MNTNIEKIKTEIQPQPLTSPDNWITTALNKGMSIEVLERLFAMKKEYDVTEAKKAFDEAMALFQSKCPTIKKMKRGGVTKDGDVAYYYAPIEDIEQQTKALRAECYFSYLIKTEFPDGKVRAYCEVRHIQGHSETSMVEMPLLTKTGVMSDAQVVAGTTTFCKRYAFVNAFGIMTADEDRDGVTDAQQELFNDLIKDWDYTEWKKAEAETISDRKVFQQFLDNIPTQEQVSKFKKLSANLPEGVKKKQWITFQKLIKGNADAYLKQLEEALNNK